MGETKKCPKCGQEKLITEFYVRRDRKDGRRSYCKTCQKRLDQLHAVKRKYGIEEEEYDRLMAETNCAICGKEFSSTCLPQIDHCHTNGHVRGVLCVNCNTALGLFKDSILTMKTAISYLA